LANLIIQQPVKNVPVEALTGQILNPSASCNSTGVLVSPSPSWEDLIRHERTAGGLAVMEGIRETEAGEVNSPGLPEPSPLNSIPTTITTRIVGLSKIKSLLQPLHKFYADKKAWVEKFLIYDDSGEEYTRRLVYPKIKVENKLNPYRKYQLNSKSSARSFKRMKQFVEARSPAFNDFKFAGIVLTFPDFMSKYLASLGKPGRDMAWRLWDGFFEEDLKLAIKQNVNLASHTNLHLWKTENPLLPHFHFHAVLPNYGLSNTGVQDEDGEQALEFIKWNWSRQRGGREVPFSDEQLENLKQLWLNRLARFCRRHGIEFKVQKINIYVEYLETWEKLHHKFNYNGRHWSEDYAKYSNLNLECPDPPAWLLDYSNKARVKGWWCSLKSITTESEEKEKVSPYTGQNMHYVDTYEGMSIDTLLKYAGDTLGGVEFVKGHPFEYDLTKDDLNWLKGVMVLSTRYPVDSFQQGRAYELEE
jgi:hypothetical protein